jgi:hypothetical protein
MEPISMKITIQQFIERLPKFDNNERAEYIPRLLNKLSQVSYNQLINFQNCWDETRPPEDFTKEQDKEIIACIKMEITDLCQAVRELYDLPPITYNTEV